MLTAASKEQRHGYPAPLTFRPHSDHAATMIVSHDAGVPELTYMIQGEDQAMQGVDFEGAIPVDTAQAFKDVQKVLHSYEEAEFADNQHDYEDEDMAEIQQRYGNREFATTSRDFIPYLGQFNEDQAHFPLGTELAIAISGTHDHDARDVLEYKIHEIHQRFVFKYQVCCSISAGVEKV
jgi:hypothetical protein